MQFTNYLTLLQYALELEEAETVLLTNGYTEADLEALDHDEIMRRADRIRARCAHLEATHA